MASGKQINELSSATIIDSNDNVVLAQQSKTEATKATISQLANAIGDELNTGAYAELTYATSQGKNAIAQSLTNKGISTTSFETLIQMADKINQLNIDSNTENMLGTGLLSYTTVSPSSYQYNKYFYNRLNKSIVILSGTMLYYIEQDEYTDYNDMISNAKYTYDIFSLNNSYTLNRNNTVNMSCISEDYTKLMVVDIDGSYTNLVFNIDENQGFTLLHTFNKQLYNKPAIRDDGNYVFWMNSSNAYVYDITNDTDYTYTTQLASDQYASLMKNNTIYIVYGSGSNIYKAKLLYDIVEGTVNLGSVIASTNLYTSDFSKSYSNIWLYTPGQENDTPCFVLSNGDYSSYGQMILSTEIDNGSLYKLWIRYVTFPSSFSSGSSVDVKQHDLGYAVNYTTSGFYVAPTTCLSPIMWSIKSVDNGVVTYTIPVINFDIQYDISTQNFSGMATLDNIFAIGTNIGVSAANPIMICNGKIIYVMYDYRGYYQLNGSPSISIATYNTNPQAYMLGKRYVTATNYTQYFTHAVSSQDLLDGKYDANISISPVVPDEE